MEIWLGVRRGRLRRREGAVWSAAGCVVVVFEVGAALAAGTSLFIDRLIHARSESATKAIAITMMGTYHIFSEEREQIQ